jgi:hypothetical protein
VDHRLRSLQVLATPMIMKTGAPLLADFARSGDFRQRPALHRSPVEPYLTVSLYLPAVRWFPPTCT